MSQNKIYHYTFTRTEYDLAVKDPHAIYFVTETDGTITLYKGTQQCSNAMQIVQTFPQVGEAGKFYLNMALGEIRIWTTQWVTVFPYSGGGGGGTGDGDMKKSVYDTNNDGKVNAADEADSVPYSGVTGKPASFPPSQHTHDYDDIEDAPTVGSGTLTITVDGTVAGTFNANATENVTIPIPGGGGTITVDSALSSSSVNPVQNKVITQALNGKQATISSSNKLPYAYLSDTPTIPTTLSALSDDSTHRLVTDAEKSAWDAKSDFSGSYNDLTNKPTIPAAQVQADWNVTDTTSKAFIKNKPTIPTVNNPTITFTQGGVTKGTITLNQSGNQTIPFDAGGGGGSSWTGYTTVESSAASLTVEFGKAYVWTVDDGSADLYINDLYPNASYEIPIIIKLTSGTVTLHGMTFDTPLNADMCIYGVVVKAGGEVILYIYDMESYVPVVSAG